MALTEAELLELLRDTESDLVERKETLSDKDRVCEAVCAFSNDLPDHRRPGVIFIGASDSGDPAGLRITDGLLQELGAIRSDGNLLPPPALVVRKVNLAGSDVAVVEVQPSPSPPTRFRGRTWIRVGPRRAIATADEERRLNEKRRSRDSPFDSTEVSGAALDDLDIDLFVREYRRVAFPPAVLAENHRTDEEQLAALRFITAESIPTAAGLLVLGKEPTEFLPGAYVQFLRIDGHELTDPIKDQKRLDGTLIDILRQLDELLSLNVSVATDITSGPVEQQTPDIPLTALQQVVRNALMHRNYEHTNAPIRITWYRDRVEISSPGGAFGIVNPENFGQPGVTDYRNPTLAEAMRALGYVQRFGVGLELARTAMASNGNLPPEFSVNPTQVGVVLWSRT